MKALLWIAQPPAACGPHANAREPLPRPPIASVASAVCPVATLAVCTPDHQLRFRRPTKVSTRSHPRHPRLRHHIGDGFVLPYELGWDIKR